MPRVCCRKETGSATMQGFRTDRTFYNSRFDRGREFEPRNRERFSTRREIEPRQRDDVARSTFEPQFNTRRDYRPKIRPTFTGLRQENPPGRDGYPLPDRQSGAFAYGRLPRTRADRAGSVPQRRRWDGLGNYSSRSLSPDPRPAPRVQGPAYRRTSRAPSYADVVRERRSRSRSRNRFGDGARMRGSRSTDPRGRYFDNRGEPYQSASPEFGKSLRLSFAMIKIQHHLNNLRDARFGTATLMIEDKVRELSNGIKPAIPSNKIMQTLQNLARQWGEGVSTALREHYAETIRDIENEIQHDPFDRWPEAFEVAVRWIDRGMPRVTENTLVQAQNKIADMYDDLEYNDNFPPLGEGTSQAHRTGAQREQFDTSVRDGFESLFGDRFEAGDREHDFSERERLFPQRDRDRERQSERSERQEQRSEANTQAHRSTDKETLNSRLEVAQHRNALVERLRLEPPNTSSKGRVSAEPVNMVFADRPRENPRPLGGKCMEKSTRGRLQSGQNQKEVRFETPRKRVNLDLPPNPPRTKLMEPRTLRLGSTQRTQRPLIRSLSSESLPPGQARTLDPEVNTEVTRDDTEQVEESIEWHAPPNEDTMDGDFVPLSPREGGTFNLTLNPTEQMESDPLEQRKLRVVLTRQPTYIQTRAQAEMAASFVSSDVTGQFETAEKVKRILQDLDSEEETQMREAMQDEADMHSIDLFEEQNEQEDQSDTGETAYDAHTGDRTRPLVNCHGRTNRKTRDWSLNIESPLLILGDSNVARITKHSIPDLQIDSFPGGTFLNVKHFLQTATHEVQPNVIILAFGINSRRNDFKATTMKQIQTAHRELRRLYPQAHVVVPLVNYSDRLPEAEKLALEEMNNYILRSCLFIDLLPGKYFSTVEDDIHWTEYTANMMVQHWCEQLNSALPLKKQ